MTVSAVHLPLDLDLAAGPDLASAPVGEFADAMSSLASGVVLVTCRLGGRPWGVTVTAFASVSADPPTVLVSLGSASTSARAIATSRRFGVSILSAEQIALARYSSAPGGAKFLEAFVDPDRGNGASPLVRGALAHLDCEVVDVVEVADHTIFFGRVRTADASPGGEPLLYHRRGYPHETRSLRCLSS